MFSYPVSFASLSGVVPQASLNVHDIDIYSMECLSVEVCLVFPREYALWAGVPQKGCCVYPVRQCAISTCPIIDDANFDNSWLGFSTLKYLFFLFVNKKYLVERHFGTI